LENEVKVSVIIPTRNGEQYLWQLLVTLREQSLRPAQILVVDSSSEDNTVTICRDFAVDIIPIDVQNFDHGGTRNLAASKAIGDVLVWMTQDALFRDAECLGNLIRPLSDSKVAASYGRQIPREEANPLERFARLFNYPPAGMIKGMDDLPRLGVKTFFFSNVCSAVKRLPFQEVGGFPVTTIMNEDMFLAAKLLENGYKIAYQADAVVHHSHNYPLTTQFKRYFDIGVFFRENRWLKDLAKPEKEGIKYLDEQMRFLYVNGHKWWIPYALVDNMVRYLGYRTSMLEKVLPVFLKKCASYNKDFWGCNR
jgi:rhamnosyltransferase